MKESDKILFHYTSLEGLLGIIEKRSIWATSILYLNDASEMIYSIDLFREQLVKSIREKVPKNSLNIYQNALALFVNDFLDLLISLIDKTTITPIGNYSFVSSFSEENDQLSQWRGYCPGGIGFSLGFNFKGLKEYLQHQGFSITQCIYDEEEQTNKLRDLINETFGDLLVLKNIVAPIEREKYVKLIMEFIKLAPTFKHPKFKEEKEWRIIAGPISKKDNKLIKFRIGQSMIIPYIEISLPTDGKNLVIDQIIVGPTKEPELSKASVEMMLRSKEVRYGEVQYSTIPYRHW